jgi:UDP-glucuronate 4-epimerase
MKKKNNKILITGTAGFIGFHLADRLIKQGENEIVGIDIINDYYDINLKYSRLKKHGIVASDLTHRQLLRSSKYLNYHFLKVDIADYDFIIDFMKNEKFDYVINLAAQAGVRYSIENPRAYTHSNIEGFLSIIEGCRYSGVKHLIYASTSSVYGLNTQMPLSEKQPTEHPMALYAATKKANEMIAHSYSHLFKLPTTGLRFFTVYGPWGRPDMALFLFTEAILKNKKIKVFNGGNMIRDFTYVDDIVESIVRLLGKPPGPNPNWDSRSPDISTSSAPYQIFNIGNSSPVSLMTYIEALETEIGKVADKQYMDMQPGDVPSTHADASNLENYIKFRPKTTVKEGVKRFLKWYMKQYPNNF